MPLMAFSSRVLSSTGSTYAALMRSMTSAKVRSSSSGSGALADGAETVVAGIAAGLAGSAARARGAPMTMAMVRASEVRRGECSMSNELLILVALRRASAQPEVALRRQIGGVAYPWARHHCAGSLGRPCWRMAKYSPELFWPPLLPTVEMASPALTTSPALLSRLWLWP
ncbi:hypothetical protein D9M71_493300 [compost metagenome]